MANTTKRIIQFQAQFENVKGFGEWIKNIEKNIDGSVDKSFAKWIKEYKVRLEALAKSISEMGDDPSDRGLARMRKEMNAMWTIAKKISNAFSSMSLGDDINAEIQKLLNDVEEARTKVKNAKSGKRRWEGKKGVGEVPLSDDELARLYKQGTAKGKSITFNGQTFSGEADQARFLAEIKNNIQLLESSEEAIAVAIRDRLAIINQRIEEYTAEINTNSETLKNAQEALNTAQAGLTINTEQTQLAVEGQNWVNRIGAANDASSDAEEEHQELMKKQQQEQKRTTNVVADYNKENSKTSGIVATAAKQVFAYGTVLSLFKRLVSGAKRTITELDKALTDMAVVTNLSRQEAWEMIGTFQALAKETGSTTSEIAQITTKFLQQGKSMTQALQLTEAASKAAKIAGIDGARSVDLLTNAMNGFQMSANQALEVSDKFAALAATSATDYEELAVALSKVAAQANLAGMSMDFTLGMLAKGIEVTREAPETIGTALKTVISRMRELTDYGETLEEGMDVNRVEKALENVGVQLRDTNGQFRNLEDVLSELGGKWNELNTNQQANVAVALAGTRLNETLACAWAA